MDTRHGGRLTAKEGRDTLEGAGMRGGLWEEWEEWGKWEEWEEWAGGTKSKRGPPRMKFMKVLQGVIRFLFCAYILLYIM